MKVTSGKVTADNYAQNAGSIAIGENGQTAMMALTGTGLAETGGTVTIKSGGTLDTTGLSVSSATFATSAGGSARDSGTASFTSNATFTDDGTWTVKGAATFDSTVVKIGQAGSIEVASLTTTGSNGTGSTFTDKGSVIDKGAASFTLGTVDDSGSFNAVSASFSQSTLTVSGSWVDKGALSFDSTTVSVTKGGFIDVGSLSVGSSFASSGFGSTLTVAGTVTDHGDLGIGSSVNGATVAITASALFSVGGAVNVNLNMTFLGNGILDFASSNTSTLTSQLQGTINGFADHNGILDFSKIGFDAKEFATYNTTNGELDLEKANGTLLADVFLNTASSYGSFAVKADSTNHTEIVVGPARMA